MDTNLTNRIKKYLKTVVKQSRYEHSVRTAILAEQMCKVYGEDPNKGYLAGIAHDICKDMGEQDMIATAKRDGMPVLDIELNNPFLLHGRASAVVLVEKFNVSDEDVLSAISNHTLGCAGLCNLAKIIFVADKIEPGRPHSSDEYRAKLLAMPLNEMTLAVLNENIEYLASKGKTPASLSLEFKRDLELQL